MSTNNEARTPTPGLWGIPIDRLSTDSDAESMRSSEQFFTPASVAPEEVRNTLSSDEMMQEMYRQMERLQQLPQNVASALLVPRQLTVNIVGQQDAGKSSTLNNMVDLKVCPEAHGVVTTKLPTLVVIEPNSESNAVIIEGRTSAGQQLSRSVDNSIVSIEVDRMQHELIDDHVQAGRSAERIMQEVELIIRLVRSIWSLLLCAYTFNNLMRAIVCICLINRIPASQVMRSVPEYAVQFRDTKGLAGVTDASDKVTELMSDPHNLFLLVMSATTASSTTDQCVQLFSTNPDVWQRTILVLTKPDTVERAVLRINFQQRILKVPQAPIGDSIVTQNIDVVGIINNDLNGNKQDESVWLSDMIRGRHLTNPTLARHLGVPALLMAIERKQKAHVINCVIPYYISQLRQELQVHENRLSNLQRVPPLCEVLIELGFPDRMLNQLNVAMTEVGTYVRNRVRRTIRNSLGFITSNVVAAHTNIETFAVHQRNSTEIAEGLIDLLAGTDVPHVAGKMVWAACERVMQITAIHADVPAVTAAIKEHLRTYARAQITPEVIAEIKAYMTTLASSHKYTVPAASTVQHYQDCLQRVQEPAEYFVKSAVLATYQYIQAGTFQQWCESNFDLLYLHDYQNLISEHEQTEAVIANYNSVIDSVEQMLASASVQ
jgi:Dynamin family